MDNWNIEGIAEIVQVERHARVQAELANLRAECRAHAIRLTSDEAVNQHAAARLVDRSHGVLRNWRLPSCCLPIGQRIVGRKIAGKVSYPLIEIATWRVINSET